MNAVTHSVVFQGLRRVMVLLFVLACHGNIAFAAVTSWSGNVDNDFTNAGNWSDGVPSSFDDLAAIEGGNNLPVIIPATAGTMNVGAIQLGVDQAAGSLIQNGGVLVIDGAGIGEESVVGLFTDEDSSWVLNNNAVVLYDEPLGGEGDGLDTDGAGLDFDVGKSVPEGAVGLLELHNTAILRISDDLKIADGDGGHGIVRLDGESQITVGSGISASGISEISVSGNALLVTGNSGGPGNTQEGRTNEGYLTLSTGDGEEALIQVSESGKIYARTLQQRGGVSTISLRDNGQLHVFDVFEFAAPDPGKATVSGEAQGPQRTSLVSQSAGAETTIQLFDDAVMSFDTDLEDSGWSGLALSGGNNRGGNSDGGLTLIEINDRANFLVQQDLNMTLGVGDFAESTLSVRGADAIVVIGGDLRMALSDFDDENVGVATLEAVITGEAHATINVGGSALIGNGELSVKLDGYTPTGGESYQLMLAGEIVGSNFRAVDLPPLSDGLSWSLAIGTTSIDLSVSLPGDFNGNGILDVGDIDNLTMQSASATNPPAFDLNADTLVDSTDVTIWIKDLFNSWIGDANLDGEFSTSDLVVVLASGTYEVDTDAVWSTGDFNGDGRANTSDLVTALADGGYEVGPRAAVSAVPEPSTLGMAIPLGVALFWRRRRNVVSRRR